MPWDNYSQQLITFSGGNLSANAVADFSGIGVAVDLTAAKLWFMSHNHGWNGDTNLANQDPVAGNGGLDISGISGTDKYVGMSCYNAAGSINLGGSAFKFTQPSGYSAWGASDTFNSADKGANITLSGGDLIATSSTAAWNSVRSVGHHSSGKYYFEIAKATYSTTNFIMGGICDSTASLTNHIGSSVHGLGLLSSNGHYWKNNVDSGTLIYCGYPLASGSLWRRGLGTTGYSSGKYYFEVSITGIASNIFLGAASASSAVMSQVGGDAQGYGWLNTGQVWTSNAAQSPNIESYANTNTVAIAVDIDNSKIWWYKTKWNNDVIANQNPATNTGGRSLSALTAPIYSALAFYGWTSGDSLTANFGASAFTYTVPSGFSAWEPASSFRAAWATKHNQMVGAGVF